MLKVCLACRATGIEPRRRLCDECRTARDRRRWRSRATRYPGKPYVTAARDASRLERFMAKVHQREDGCWHWTGSLHGQGEPLFWDGTRCIRAKRWIYDLTHEPAGEQDVHRTCRTVTCVNPEHLTLQLATARTS